MKTNTKRIVLLGVLSLALAAAGCQLIVDFDRTKIDAGAVDASFDVNKPDTTVQDSGNDVVVTDGGTDATGDAAGDATTDASDAAADADDAASDASDAAAD